MDESPHVQEVVLCHNNIGMRTALSHWQKIPSKPRLRGRRGKIFINGVAEAAIYREIDRGGSRGRANKENNFGSDMSAPQHILEALI